MRLLIFEKTRISSDSFVCLLWPLLRVEFGVQYRGFVVVSSPGVYDQLLDSWRC